LIERLEGHYRFMHDRMQEAAYSLIPETLRAEVHLRNGRRLAAHTPPEEREQAIFDIANQFNRGAALITQQEERDQLAELNLIAGLRAKGSTAYASALSYLNAGAALLTENSWERRHELAFQLELHRAECEFLTGQSSVAEERLEALSNRATTIIEKAIVACLRTQVCAFLDQTDCAVAVCLEYLQRVGIWELEGPILDANDAFLRMIGYDHEDLVSGRLRWTDLTPPECREQDARLLSQLKRTESLQPFEKEYFRKDGSRVPVLIGAAAFDESWNQGVAFIIDLSEHKRAEAELREGERRYREVQWALTHASRVATMGQLTASIAHEVNQPIATARNNAAAALRFLSRNPPDLEEVPEALDCVVNDTDRAGDIVNRIRALVKKVPPRSAGLDINDAISELVALARSELVDKGVTVRIRLSEGLPLVHGDRVQLQQVVLNLILNVSRGNDLG
jgi:PAS domain S-box-containing protein